MLRENKWIIDITEYPEDEDIKMMYFPPDMPIKIIMLSCIHFTERSIEASDQMPPGKEGKQWCASVIGLQ